MTETPPENYGRKGQTGDTPYPLGRVKRHDPRSRDYPFVPKRLAHEAMTLEKMPNVSHRYYGRYPLDQGSLGACTGFSAATMLNTKPYHKLHERLRTDVDGKLFYHWATEIDPWPGTWEPDDTGSSGTAAAVGLKNAGIITAFHWGFTWELFLAQLVENSVSVGTNWYHDMFETDAHGVIQSMGGGLAGGHQYTLTGYSKADRLFRGKMAWGPGYGKNGTFFMKPEMIRTLLFTQEGDSVTYDR
jgi:hypothetical protein